MKSLFLILFLVVLLLFVPSVVLPQVHIREKVEIRPKGEFSISISSSSGNLPSFEGSIVPNSRIQGISVRRPCTIVGSGTLTSGGPFNVSILIILGTYPNEADLTNASGSIQGYCGDTVPIELWTWTSAAIVITNVTATISGNQATYNFTGYQSFPHPINVPFTANVTLQAVPIGNSDPSTLVMEASPPSLEADGSNELTSEIGAIVFDNTGALFQYCGTASMLFTIENPMEGVTLRGTGSDGLPREGTAIEVRFSGSSSGVTFVWDGGALLEDSVIVRVRADGFGLSETQEITLKGFKDVPECAVIEFDSKELAPGDTTGLSFFRLVDEVKEPFPEGQLFDVLLFGGKGTLLSSEGDTGKVLKGVAEPVYYVAPESIEGVSIVVQMAAQTSLTGGAASIIVSAVAMASAGGDPEGAAVELPNVCQLSGLVVKEEHFEILLGESKYYQAKVDPEVPHKLVIEEVGGQSLNGGIAADVWGENPLNIASGDKVGVYWEKFKPIVNATSVGNEQLPAGLIRLVGRYWDYEGKKVYKVRLSARNGEKIGSRLIEVKRPVRLLSPGQTPTYEKSNYITGEEISIDEICIRYGGEHGIPPQFLKGQMFQESYKKEAGKLWPSYRYEPWFDLMSRAGDFAKAYMLQPYWVDENGMNPDNVPTSGDHQNVKPFHYPTNHTTVGNYVADRISEYLRGSGRNQMVMGDHELLNTVMIPMVFDWYKKTYSLTVQQASDSTTSWIKHYLRNSYTEWAQTRKGASYGYSQMLYTTATLSYVGYPRPVSDAPIPENLSKTEILLPLVCKYIRRNIDFYSKTHSLGDSFEAASWNTGMELLYLYGYTTYNRNPQYQTDIIPNGYRFLPAK